MVVVWVLTMVKVGMLCSIPVQWRAMWYTAWRMSTSKGRMGYAIVPVEGCGGMLRCNLEVGCEWRIAPRAHNCHCCWKTPSPAPGALSFNASYYSFCKQTWGSFLVEDLATTTDQPNTIGLHHISKVPRNRASFSSAWVASPLSINSTMQFKLVIRNWQ